MKVNLNTSVSVTLTEAGARILNADRAAYMAKPEIVSAGYVYTTQLWTIMQVFGPHLHMGMRQVPFEGNAMEVGE